MNEQIKRTEITEIYSNDFLHSQYHRNNAYKIAYWLELRLSGDKFNRNSISQYYLWLSLNNIIYDIMLCVFYIYIYKKNRKRSRFTIIQLLIILSIVSVFDSTRVNFLR